MEHRILTSIEEMEAEREALYSMLGDLPDTSMSIGSTLVSRDGSGDFIIERWTLDLNGIEMVPALVTLPKNGDGPFPVVLYNHAHGGHYQHGKEELLTGRPAILDPPYAGVLAARGIAAVGIDTWVFGDRCHNDEASTFKKMLWNGQVMWGMMVFDNIRTIDFIADHPALDDSRIATMGLSMGSTMAWWTAALDERVKVCIDLCCLTDFHSLVETGNLNLHGVYYYVPNLLKENWSTSRINAMIAPRPRLSLAGDLDPLTPTRGLEIIDEHLKKVYSTHGVEENWKMVRYAEIGHIETDEMREEILSFLDIHL